MFYRIEKDRVEETSAENWESGQSGVAVFTHKEWEEEMDIRATYLLGQREDNIHFCKLESHANYLFGTFHIPVKREHEKNMGFAFYILPGKLIFIDDNGLVQAHIKKIIAGKVHSGYNLEKFFYDFLISLIDEDLIYLAVLEKEITKMEESMVEDELKDFNYRMLHLKKRFQGCTATIASLPIWAKTCMRMKKNFLKKAYRSLSDFCGAYNKTSGGDTGASGICYAGAGCLSVRDRNTAE